MEQKNTRLRNVGFITFFFSGICAISSGVVVSLLQEQYGFAYGMTGTLLSLMSIGNLLAGFLIAMLPGKLGMKPSILLLTIGYALGYAMMGLSGAVAVLALGFFLVGIAKGSVINTCTILVSDNSADRTRGMNLMHSCYACGALLCPFFIAAAGRVSGSFAVLVLAVLGLLLWLVYMGTPFAGKGAGKKEVTDWSFLRSTRFWLLTGLLFCQNAAEQSVTGWMVTYFKGSGIIAGALAAYTVTVMWGATLVARLLIAFVFPFKQPRKAMVVMGVSCTILVSDNSADRTRGMNLMHSCYACGALLCPFFIAAAGRVSGSFAVLVLAVLGLLLWLVYMGTPFAGKGAGKKEVTDWSFLRSTRFWLLTGLLFCQNAAEQSVTGWMVTYFKGSGIIAGALAAYTVTVMWGATLVARLLIAFVFPFKQPRKAMVVMGVSCTIFYILLVQARSQGAAIVLLFAFAFAMAGMNPTAVASAGRMTSVTSMGIMLPVAASGAILMPWVIGVVAESAGLAAGMMTNIVPCVGLVIFAVLVAKLPEE